MFFFDFYDENNSRVSPHTIKKFELISEYVKAWIPKLMNYPKCEGIVFIDCMSNSGVYRDGDGNEITGTPIRVAEIVSNTMSSYPHKRAVLYFNDLSSSKIETLTSRLPAYPPNVTIHTSVMDGNNLLKSIGGNLGRFRNMNFLLIYDPFQATIDWEAIMPFLRGWGEVIINHMVSDTIRAARVAKRPDTIGKYESTYLTTIDNLLSFSGDKAALEERVEQIARTLSGKGKRYYIASFPFFNQTNSLVYNLIHCTGNIEGFKLYKQTAWKVFDDHSSAKKTHGVEDQLVLNFEGEPGYITPSDSLCYNIHDIAAFLQNQFRSRHSVPLSDIWASLDEHPVFPSSGYRNGIKAILVNEYGAAMPSKSSITFSDRRG